MRRWAAPAAFLLSTALHAGLLGFLTFVAAPAKRSETIDLELIEVSRPPPEPAPEAPEPKRSRRVALAPPPEAPPTREPPLPPPQNTPPPPSAQAREAPVRIGVSMSSTIAAGAVASPVGNTLYGRPPDQAPDPSTVQPGRADHDAPPSEWTALPEPISTEIPKSEYPEEARRLGFEGAVRLKLRVDEEGRVGEVVVVQDPGHGLGDAAARNARRFRFRPARRAGRAVATDIPFTVRFELP